LPTHLLSHFLFSHKPNYLWVDLWYLTYGHTLCCRLEQESGFFFNMKYFEEKVHAGEWEEVEKYLAGFTKVDDNRYSMKIFFEIRKQKYLEALDRYCSFLFVKYLL
jgi:hypothetical protein